MDTAAGPARRTWLHGLAAGGAAAAFFSGLSQFLGWEPLVLAPFLGLAIGVVVRRAASGRASPGADDALLAVLSVFLIFGLRVLFLAGFAGAPEALRYASELADSGFPWVFTAALLALTSALGAGLRSGPPPGLFGTSASLVSAAVFAAWGITIDRFLAFLLPPAGWLIGRGVVRDGGRGPLARLHGVGLTLLGGLLGPAAMGLGFYLIQGQPDAIRLQIDALGPERSPAAVLGILHAFSMGVSQAMYSEGFMKFLAAAALAAAWFLPGAGKAAPRSSDSGVLESPEETRLREIEDFADRHPRIYRFNLFLLTLLGRSYLFLAAGLMVLLVLADVWTYLPPFLRGEALPDTFNQDIRGSLALAVIAGSLIRAAWIKIPHPEGLRVLPENAPGLFSLIETARAASRAPAVHEVLLTSEFNASVTQIPRGFFGTTRKNYLVIGFPLLQALTPEQFRAALTHELGHLSSLHGRFSAWVYGIRNSTKRLTSAIDQSGGGRFDRWATKAVFGKFYNWFLPRFSAYSFVLARGNEFEADRLAAAAGGPGSMAACLLRTTAVSEYLEKAVWPAVDRLAQQSPEPPGDIFSRLEMVFASAPEPLKAACRRAAFGTLADAGFSDPHPPVFARLAALDWDGSVPVEVTEPRGPSAAHAFLGPWFKTAEAELSAMWKRDRLASWAAAHSEARFKKARTRELQEESAGRALTHDELWEIAASLFDLRGFMAARPWLAKLLKDRPHHPGGRFLAGRGLLRSGDPGGLDQLYEAMKRDFERIPEGSLEIEAFLRRGGRAVDPDSIRARLADFRRVFEAAKMEREPKSGLFPLEPHGLAPGEVAALQGRFERIAGIKRVWLARKKVKNCPDKPHYILGVSAYGPQKGPEGQRLVRDLMRAFPAAGIVERVSWGKPRLRLRLGRTGPAIYRRSFSIRTLARASWEAIPFKGALAVLSVILFPLFAGILTDQLGLPARVLGLLVLVWALAIVVFLGKTLFSIRSLVKRRKTA